MPATMAVWALALRFSCNLPHLQLLLQPLARLLGRGSVLGKRVNGGGKRQALFLLRGGCRLLLRCQLLARPLQLPVAAKQFELVEASGTTPSNHPGLACAPLHALSPCPPARCTSATTTALASAPLRRRPLSLSLVCGGQLRLRIRQLVGEALHLLLALTGVHRLEQRPVAVCMMGGGNEHDVCGQAG